MDIRKVSRESVLLTFFDDNADDDDDDDVFIHIFSQVSNEQCGNIRFNRMMMMMC